MGRVRQMRRVEKTLKRDVVEVPEGQSVRETITELLNASSKSMLELSRLETSAFEALTAAYNKSLIKIHDRTIWAMMFVSQPPDPQNHFFNLYAVVYYSLPSCWLRRYAFGDF